jgi:hypothetical protein
MEQANCVGTDTNQFFTDKTMYENKELLKRICSNCDVVTECLEYSLRYNVQGWWGGTSEKMRRDIRYRLKITPVEIIEERV